METHLKRITDAERWEVWTEAQFLDVRVAMPGSVAHPGDVPSHVRELEERQKGAFLLSRWDVYELLSSASLEAFSAPSATAEGESVMLYPCPGSKAQKGAVNVVRPKSARAWITEISQARSGAPRVYRAGEWLLEIEAKSYYANVIGATSVDIAKSYPVDRHGQSTYREMLQVATPERWGSAVGALLRGDSRGDTSWPFAESARAALALFVSESVRDHRSWGATMMLQDLYRRGSYEIVLAGKHPMARGSTFGSQDKRRPTGMGGGREDRATWSFETGISMEWLVRTHAVSPHRDDARRFRDPIRGQAYVNQVKRTFRAAMRHRFEEFGDIL